LRIEYPNAWYHIMNRGRRAEKIFETGQDYEMFIQVLKETSEDWNLRISAYCLMPNHYHLLVQTPDANISRCMRHINGVYTQRFNRKHETDGSLFKGRYKSILVDADQYLLTLVKYIHENPFKAGIASTDQYEWSSHNAYLSSSRRWDWVYKDFVFRLLAATGEDKIHRYRKLISDNKNKEISDIIQDEKWPAILGGEQFTDWVKQKWHALRKDPEIPQTRELALEADTVIFIICDYYGIKREQLNQSQRGKFNEPRNVALYLLRRMRQDNLAHIGEHLGIKNYSSVSSAIERVKGRMAKDKGLKRRIIHLIKILKRNSKSQEQT